MESLLEHPMQEEAARQSLLNIRQLMPTNGKPLQIFRGTTIDAVNQILKENQGRLAELTPSDRLARVAMPEATHSVFGPGHYFSTDPAVAEHYAKKYADTEGPSTVITGRLMDKSPLIIPTSAATPEITGGNFALGPGVVHPDKELRARALQAYDERRPHMEQRLRDRFESMSMEKDDKDFFINQGLKDLAKRRENLEAGDSVEIARLGGHLGYKSAVIDVGQGPGPARRMVAHVLAYHPDAVQITTNLKALSDHFNDGQESGR